METPPAGRGWSRRAAAAGANEGHRPAELPGPAVKLPLSNPRPTQERENRRTTPRPSGPIPQPPPPSVRTRSAIPRRVRSRIDPGAGSLDVKKQETGGACDCRTLCEGSVTSSTPLFRHTCSGTEPAPPTTVSGEHEAEGVTSGALNLRLPAPPAAPSASGSWRVTGRYRSQNAANERHGTRGG